MTEIPKKNLLTGAYRLYKEGYQFIGHTCEELRTDIFQIRLFGQTAICLRGEEAAKMFYDVNKMQRKGAVPSTVQQTLTGKDAIHTTDGQVHALRKSMFLSLMTDENISRLSGLFNQALHRRFAHWQLEPSIRLFDEMARALCAAVCGWAGVTCPPDEEQRRAADFIAMVDAFSSVGLRNWRGRFARTRAERWLTKIIKDGRKNADPGTALSCIATYREPSGEPLSDRLAAIELINILRPTIAIAWYIVFAVTALHESPDWRLKFIADRDDDQSHFIDEVRRFYPLAPFMGARAKVNFDWQGYRMPKGALVLLDLYGTNHDPRLWPLPYRFDPNRFHDRRIRPFDFLAQGGGDAATGHRCPGEKITVALMHTALKFLTGEVRYSLPEQDLKTDLSRMPTTPESGVILTNIRKSFAYNY
ncbi:fatty-acid peroxygenase [Mucilaginibacter pineti]|uniref:Fatty-acid peroxygenase n=1 Tax=Mucilaginibacter pineti TaxID=1391627 RepID=A0A1G7H9K0_9SPHI|nr:cytochrome P450 [Mucilaginibacter pineti]SDE97137.1 fatty-acid peroxygenase [Mucilaginibacter pineti]